MVSLLCLSDTDADTIPGDYSLLAANGLGKKKLQLFEQSDASDIHDAILEAFPKLSSAGGYDLLRTVENSKRLTEITPPPEGYSGAYLKNVLGQAKCFIRTIQNEIELIESPALKAGNQVSYMQYF